MDGETVPVAVAEASNDEVSNEKGLELIREEREYLDDTYGENDASLENSADNDDDDIYGDLDVAPNNEIAENSDDTLIDDGECAASPVGLASHPVPTGPEETQNETGEPPRAPGAHETPNDDDDDEGAIDDDDDDGMMMNDATVGERPKSSASESEGEMHSDNASNRGSGRSATPRRSDDTDEESSARNADTTSETIHDADPTNESIDDRVDETTVAKTPKECMEEGEVEDGEIEDDDDEAVGQPEVQNTESAETEVRESRDDESLDEETLAGMSKRARKRYRKRKREESRNVDENEGEKKKRKRSHHGDDEKNSPRGDHKRRRRRRSATPVDAKPPKNTEFGCDEDRNYEYDQYLESEQTVVEDDMAMEGSDLMYDEDYSDSDEYYDDPSAEAADGSLASLFGDYMDKDGNIRLDLPERRRAKRLRAARGMLARGRGRGMPADILALARHGGMAVAKGRVEGKGVRPRRDEDPICKVFKETGVCKLGIECPFSHDCLRTDEKRQEVCKFFLMDTCAKGDRCTYLHSELPCKYWHTGYICHAGDKCKYSHEKLTEDGKALLKKVLREKPLGPNPGPKRDDWEGTDDESDQPPQHHKRAHREKERSREHEHHREHKHRDKDKRKDEKERKSKSRKKDKENREEEVSEDNVKDDSQDLDELKELKELKEEIKEELKEELKDELNELKEEPKEEKKEDDKRSKDKKKESKDSKESSSKDSGKDKDRKDKDRNRDRRDRRDRDKDRKRSREREERHDDKRQKRDGLLGSGPDDGKVPSLLDIRVFPDASPPRPGAGRRERRNREWRARGRGRGRGHRFDGGPPFDGQFDMPPFEGPPFEGPPFDGPPFDGPYDMPFDPRFERPPMGPLGPPPWGPDMGPMPPGPPGLPGVPGMPGMPFDLANNAPPGMPNDMINMMASAIASAIRGNVQQKEEDAPYSQEKIAAQVAERLAAMKQAHLEGHLFPETSQEDWMQPGQYQEPQDLPPPGGAPEPSTSTESAPSEGQLSELPDNLPPVQRQLMLRLQQNQKDAQLPPQNERPDDDNWYSSDEEESKQKAPQNAPNVPPAPASVPSSAPPNIMDILKRIGKPSEEGASNPTMDRVLKLLQGARPPLPGPQAPPSLAGPPPSMPGMNEPPPFPAMVPPQPRAPLLGQNAFSPAASRDPRQRQQSRFAPQQPPNYSGPDSGYSDSPLSPPVTTASAPSFPGAQQEWFIVQGITRVPMKWNLVVCSVEQCHKPSLPNHVSPNDSKEDPRFSHYRTSSSMRTSKTSYQSPQTSFSKPSPQYQRMPTPVPEMGNFGFGRGAPPPRPPFVPPVPTALLPGTLNSEPPKLGLELNATRNNDPRRNDPRGKRDPRSRDESRDDVWSPRGDIKDPLALLPTPSIPPLPSLPPLPKQLDASSVKDEKSDAEEEKMSHRNDPRFKRRKSANAEEKVDPLVSRKRTMEYNSPLSGGAKEQSSTDAYSAYNRPRVRPTTNNNRNSSPVQEERSVTPIPVMDQQDIESDLILGPDAQQQGSLKDVFNQIDPAASPFC